MPREKIRNFSKFLGAYLISLLNLVAIAGIFIFGGCNKVSTSHFNNRDKTDSVLIAQQVEAIVNPEFTSVQEVIQFRRRTNEGFTIDSIFRAMPEQIINNAATVIIKKQGVVTKKSLVEEYRANKSVYDNLPMPPDQYETMKQENDAETTSNTPRLISTSYSYRTDTVNGIPRKVQIKKEESYVEQ